MKLHPRFKRGIYLLPNSLTIAGLFAGFYAIIAAMEGKFETAIISVFIAMTMDFLDGSIARLTHTQSLFGTELDSLADIVSFGVTPGLIIYTWSLRYLGKIGWLIAFLFTASAALRLARFNAGVKLDDDTHFQGLPAPAAGGVLISFLWTCVENQWLGKTFAMPIALLTAFISLLMVSPLHYPSIKSLNFKGRVPFIAILTVLFALVGIALEPPRVLFFIFMVYSASPLIHLLSPSLSQKWLLKPKSFSQEQSSLLLSEDDDEQEEQKE